jgi:hypothetical protein
LFHFVVEVAMFINRSCGFGWGVCREKLDMAFDAATCDILNKNIQYSDMMLEKVVTDSALLTLCIEILTHRGPLPVGEIGKILAELTGIPNLSTKLKDKFGGLKRFLERFPDVVVFSNDHPFNPHALLRSALAPELLDLIDRGIFPVQLINKTKKVSNSFFS